MKIFNIEGRAITHSYNFHSCLPYKDNKVYLPYVRKSRRDGIHKAYIIINNLKFVIHKELYENIS